MVLFIFLVFLFMGVELAFVFPFGVSSISYSPPFLFFLNFFRSCLLVFLFMFLLFIHVSCIYIRISCIFVHVFCIITHVF